MDAKLFPDITGMAPTGGCSTSPLLTIFAGGDLQSVADGQQAEGWAVGVCAKSQT